MLLSNLKIKNSPSKEKPYKLSDGEGLYLLVKSNGSKLWQFRYSYAGKEKTASYGKYPTVSLAEARGRKKADQELLRQFIEPNAYRRREKRHRAYENRNTFEAVATDWFQDNKDTWVISYAEDVWRRLELHLFPHLAKRPIVDIEPLELLDVIKLIEPAGTTDITHRLMQCCKAIYEYAIFSRRAKFNIAVGLHKGLKKHQKRHHPTLHEYEVGSFLRAFEHLNTSVQNKCAFSLLLLTALRTKELRYAQWKHINWKDEKWVIPAETMKMRRDHIVPLSSQAMQILRVLSGISTGSKWIFPSQCGYRHEVMSENTINHMIHRMGYKGRIVGHGFRALFSTMTNEHSEFHADAIERQLAHVEKNQVRAAYNRAEYLAERRRLMQWWGNWLIQKGLIQPTGKDSIDRLRKDAGCENELTILGYSFSATPRGHQLTF